MLKPPIVSAALVFALTSSAWSSAPANPRSGFVLVANQQSASASLIDLKDDSARVIAVGNGPHEAVIAPSGKVAVVTVYGISGQPGNQLAVVDVAKGVVTKTISLGQYTRPHGAMFLPGENRVAVTSETTQNLVLVNLSEGVVEGAVATTAAGSHMVAVTADGSRAFTANIGGGSVSEIDLTARKLVRTIEVAPRVEGIAVTRSSAIRRATGSTSPMSRHARLCGRWTVSVRRVVSTSRPTAERLS